MNFEAEIRKEMRELEERISHRINVAIQSNERRDAELKKLIEPIAKTYDTVSTLGRWIMGVAVFVSIVIGVISGLSGALVHILHRLFGP